MSNLPQLALAILVFVLILSVWNWVTKNLPGSVGGGLEWIILLVAAISGIIAYLATSQR